MLALLAAAQPAPALVNRADEASQAYIGCLFAVSRQANAARLPLAEFERRLSSSCVAEERVAQRLVAQVLSERGERNPAVAAGRLMHEARSSVVGTYESLQRLEPQLESLAEICKQQPDACK